MSFIQMVDYSNNVVSLSPHTPTLFLCPSEQPSAIPSVRIVTSITIQPPQKSHSPENPLNIPRRS